MSLTLEQRAAQASILLSRTITTAVSGDSPILTRAEYIAKMAAKYNVDPAVLAGVVLAEQRDQSLLEDSADRHAGSLGLDASIGIAQVNVSTAERYDLIPDGLPAEMSISEALEYDDVSIEAAAKYLRIVADQGAALKDSDLSEWAELGVEKYAMDTLFVGDATSQQALLSSMGSFDLGGLAGNHWSAAQTYMLGSEYTSTPWDRDFKPAWGMLVAIATEDVRAAGYFQ